MGAVPDAVSAEALLREGLRARAAALARGGALADAGRLLDAAGGADADTLDLLARIRAQAGEWLEAERLWLQVLAARPDHAGAQAGLARVRAGRRQLAWPVAGLVAGAIALGAGAALWRSSERQAAAIEALQTGLQAQHGERLEREREARVALEQRLAALAESQQRLGRQLAAAAGPAGAPRLGFVSSGMRQQVQGESLWIWFDADLLDASARPTALGAARLRALARAVARTQQPLRVEVVAIEREGGTPALQRARAAAQVLQGTGVLPREAVAAWAASTEPASAWRGPSAAQLGTTALVLRIHRGSDAATS